MDDLLQQLSDEIRRKEAAAARLNEELAELHTAWRVFQRMQGAAARPQDEGAVNDADDATDDDWSESGPEEPLPVERTGLGLIPREPAEKDLRGRTIQESAAIILREYAAKGRPSLHFKEIADKARGRGYEGRSDKALQQSFWATLKRNPGMFRAMGQGRFTLAERFEQTEHGQGGKENEEGGGAAAQEA